MEIPAVFVSTHLHFIFPKTKMEDLCKKFFKADLLGGLSSVSNNIDENLTIPMSMDYNVMIRNDNDIEVRLKRSKHSKLINTSIPKIHKRVVFSYKPSTS